jgi:Ca-activated chloride channel family protein
MKLGGWFAFGAVFLTSGISATGQFARVETIAARHTTEFRGRSPSEIRLDVKLVLVPVTVTDPYERLVQGLRKSDFKVFDDGVEQQISQFYRDESPISVGVIFDASSSMLRRIDMSKRAMSAFLERCMPEDEFFLIRFSDRPDEVQSFTKDVLLIEDLVGHIQPNGWTALYDAIYLGMNRMRRATYSNKVLLILSDGGDNNSRYTERELKSIVQEADVRLYAISIFDRSPTLEKLADSSGGRTYRVRNLEDLPEVAEKISEELHGEYVLGYAPSEFPRDGRYRKLTVQLAPQQDGPPLRVSWRHGYYSPSR